MTILTKFLKTLITIFFIFVVAFIVLFFITIFFKDNVLEAIKVFKSLF